MYWKVVPALSSASPFASPSWSSATRTRVPNFTSTDPLRLVNA